MPFKNLGLRPELLSAITARGYKTATPIQSKAIPKVLAGRDVMAGAQTGTGKTAAFALPILQLLSDNPKKGHRPRALILTPTRELAAQILDFIEHYNKDLSLRSAVVFGGVNIRPQITKLRKGIDILVATPGRLLDHAGQKTVDLSHIEILVLDEADRMLDMGFIHDIRKVIQLMPRKRQNLLFSATYSEDIKKLADKILTKPALIEVATRNTTAETVAQVVHPVSRSGKRALLSQLIRDGKWNQVLVFTRTKHGANRLAKQLNSDGITASAIHGNKSQGARTLALSEFKSNKIRVLVATDIAARGLDIKLLPHVVNYELPDVAESYVHRIGRTGRAGTDGKAISLVSPEESSELRGIHKLLGRLLPVEKIEGVVALPEPRKPSRGRPASSRTQSRQTEGMKKKTLRKYQSEEKGKRPAGKTFTPKRATSQKESAADKNKSRRRGWTHSSRPSTDASPKKASTHRRFGKPASGRRTERA